MRGITRRTTGWLGITFVVLLFLNAGMVSLPPSSWSEQAVAEFYAANRSIILVAQVIGLIAAPVFVTFALGLQKNMSGSGGFAGTGAVGWAGILVALVSVGTAVPVIALSLSVNRISFWVRMTDVSDAVLFAAIAIFCIAGVFRTGGAPVWWRAASGLVGLTGLARSIAGFAGIASFLDIAAPFAFIAFVLSAGIYLLLAARTAD